MSKFLCSSELLVFDMRRATPILVVAASGENMENEYKRAVRRHHLARIKRARAKHWTVHFFNETNDSQSKPYLRRLGIAASTPKACSCWKCGNPRHALNEKTNAEISDLEFMALLVSEMDGD